MRGVFGKLGGGVGVFWVTMTVAGPAGGQLQDPAQMPTAGQVSGPTSGPSSSQSAGRPPFGQEPDTPQDEAMRRFREEAAKKQNIERQKHLVADTEKICRLVQELSVSTAAGHSSISSSALAKKAEEIEKLARNVRERMASE